MPLRIKIPGNLKDVEPLTKEQLEKHLKDYREEMDNRMQALHFSMHGTTAEAWRERRETNAAREEQREELAERKGGLLSKFFNDFPGGGKTG